MHLGLSSGLGTHLTSACSEQSTVVGCPRAEAVPEAACLRGSGGRGGREEAVSRAARERRCPKAEGGAFPVGRERAGPGLHVGAEDSDGRRPAADPGWWVLLARCLGPST